MRTRKADKEPDSDEAPPPRRMSTTKRSSGTFHGNKATCSRMNALRAFYKVKEWIEDNEPEFFDAFTKKTDVKGKRKSPKGALQAIKKHK